MKNHNSYSIWLIPNDEIYKILNNLILELSYKFTNIKFIPHVTLISGFFGELSDLEKKTKNLAHKISSFKVFLNEVEYLNEFFRFIFLKVNEDKNFHSVRLLAKNEFEILDTDFIPHLSLAYGKLDKTISLEMKSYSIEKLSKVKYFNVDKIYLVHNDEINFKWNVVAGYSLKNNEK